jgi:hypothetical protein
VLLPKGSGQVVAILFVEKQRPDKKSCRIFPETPILPFLLPSYVFNSGWYNNGSTFATRKKRLFFKINQNKYNYG